MEHPIKKFVVTRSMRYFGLELNCGIKQPDGHWNVCQSPAMVPVDRGAPCPEPMLVLEDCEAAALMDALWDAGVRPSSGEGNLGMIGAMKEHIADLQKDVEFLRHHIDVPNLTLKTGCEMRIYRPQNDPDPKDGRL